MVGMSRLAYEPSTALRPLAPIIGRWATRGETTAADGKPAQSIVGLDTYEWMGGGQFVVHHVHVRMGDEPVEAIEMIGEPDGGAFMVRSFDQAGAYGEMRATIDEAGTFSFVGSDLRALLEIAGDGESMKARWERRTDVGDWTHLMELSFTRLS